MSKVKSLYYEVLTEMTSPDFQPFDYKDRQFLKGVGFFGVYFIIQLVIASLDMDISLEMGLSNIILLTVFGFIIEPQKKLDLEKVKTILPLTLIMSFAVLFVSNLLISKMSNSGIEQYSEALNNIPLGLKYTSVFIYAPIIEEIVFRGTIYPSIRNALNSMLGGAIISSILFVIGHGTIAHIFPSMFFGIFLCLVYEFTGNIYVNMISHFIYNFLAFILEEFLYTDGIMGLIISIICNFIIVTTLGLLYLASKRKNHLLPNQKLFCPPIQN